jgi:hypothetical protein
MTAPIQPSQAVTWQERLKDSSWVTIGWEWLQALLGRSVDFVLWTTMIFSCYQLIPGAPQPATEVSTCMFILQFIALDVGGLGLNRLAEQQGLNRWAYARVVAYILIGITLVTISYVGIEHAVKVPAGVTSWIEAMLVIARSIMTVLYGQAIHSLKAQEESTRERLAELEERAPAQQEELEHKQQEASSLRVQVNTVQGEMSRVQEQLDREQHATSTLRVQLNTAQIEAGTLRAQLEGKQQELERMHEAVSSEQEQVNSQQRGKVVRLDTNRARKSGQEAVENALAEQIRELLTAEPGLSGRAIASRLGCSPTTAAKWKGVIETETTVVNR